MEISIGLSSCLEIDNLPPSAVLKFVGPIIKDAERGEILHHGFRVFFNKLLFKIRVIQFLEIVLG